MRRDSTLAHTAARCVSGRRTAPPRARSATFCWMTDGRTPPAGWYPVDGGQERYWDGTAWTEHVRTPPDASATASIGQRTREAAERTLSTEVEVPAGTIWAAVGKPLTRVGAGRYRLDSHYLFFESGALRTDSQQVPISAVVDVDVQQSMGQKARGIFTVLVHVQRAQGIEIVKMEDIPDGREAMRVINETAHAARLAIQQNANTMRYQSQVQQVQPARAAEPVAAAPASDSLDPFAQLRKLGELRDAGILTDEEFAAKKAEILSRL
jgi:hypothetical protein